ncbi:isoleucine--tRNA ligase [Qipengyuania sp. DY56-A-20]|uniref:Isoleucine--tRNA ligase n=1 Tax=Qipengyuania benthica TaxID=3067651 RepID=A0ABT9HBB4_9SPHN|nr:isoleucine--tRNA ligase [Qipengyuania sp. DY56-A-20]MDP4540617.1 isoleucine--tRNA ligase [Qipengyuania sp. DY56-A-20]
MTEPRDYRDTVFLPKTDFPMKAGLPQKEPGILARWQQEKLYEELRAARAGREKFILHDGPPYANGDIHVGHALNHVLKDMVCRTQTLLGKDAPYVPGWDCHGLPIEWKVEEQYRKKKLNKDEVPPAEFRAECRAYAQGWVDTQREQLKRLGCLGDWDHPYLTMDFAAEATIVGELMKFAEAGNLYRGSKPVMWSPVEKTALAEAEVEYENIVSTQIDVAFEIVESPNVPELKGAYAVIWTTTPWTIPVNQAIAYGPDVEYVLLVAADASLELEKMPLEERRAVSFSLLIAKELVPSFVERTGLICAVAKTIKGSELAGTLARHPIYELLKSRRPGPRAGAPLPSGAAQEGSGTPDQIRGDEGGDVAHGDELVGDEGENGKAGEAAWQKALEFYARPRPFLAGDFVTTDSGTGLVHMSPDHGEDDFALCKTVGIEPVFAVMDDGRYRDDWPWLGAGDLDNEGKERRRAVINKPFNAPDGPICNDLREAGALLAASEDYAHSYPHSWRSKAKVIYRCTPQWFVPMDKPLDTDVVPAKAGTAGGEGAGPGAIPASAGMTNGPGSVEAEGSTLRAIALSEIERVDFIPEKGRNRIRSMVEGRPDWVLSRQRAWGVPITLFVKKGGNDYLRDPAVNARIVAAIRESGVDGWNEAAKAELLGPDYAPGDYEMVGDILDVWFDSGCTHVFTLESGRWPALQWPADLYLEGSDQHRGWFQSSLMESCATRGRAPYDQVLTHGFTMDSQGKKMSKSLGNTIDPLKVMEQYGADIIRLWALSVDYTEDHRIGDEILKGVADQYRKLRNTFRYLLGALDGFVGDMGDAGEVPELERYVLALLAELDAKLRAAALAYDFNAYTRLLVDFCNEDLSAFYFDIRKDVLYCDGPDSTRRNAYRTVLDLLFHALVRYAAPVLVFTAEEVWQTRYPAAPGELGGSVHLLEWPVVPGVEADQSRWDELRSLREEVMEAIEPLRREKVIRSGLEADVVVPAARVPAGFDEAALAELFITASVTIADSEAVQVTRSPEDKCGRCWRLLPSVAEDGALCDRCETAVAQLDAAA